MELKLTKTQLRTLVKLVYLGKWIAQTPLKEDGKDNFDEVFQIFLARVHKEGLTDWVEYDKTQKEYHASEALEEDEEVLNVLDEYNDDTLWYELSYRLAEEEILQTEGKKAFEDLSLEQIFLKRGDVMEKYLNEFSKHGLEKFCILKKTTGPEKKPGKKKIKPTK